MQHGTKVQIEAASEGESSAAAPGVYLSNTACAVHTLSSENRCNAVPDGHQSCLVALHVCTNLHAHMALKHYTYIHIVIVHT